MKKIIKKVVAKVAIAVKEEEKVIHTWGKWVERPRRTETLVCTCGNRYIKTRKNQTECISCITKHAKI
jgi:hypothetical protein